ASDCQTQLKTVNEIGMRYISLRGINDKNIGDYSVEMIKKDVLPRLKQWDIGVSSIGSPIGKIYINDEDAFQKQLATLKTLCEISQLRSEERRVGIEWRDRNVTGVQTCALPILFPYVVLMIKILVITQ